MLNIYRIIQEWVNNILKYSGASKIEIQLVGHEYEISLSIEDNGNGFNTSALENASGNGWKNIQSRIRLIHGEIDLDSTEGKQGTTLMAKIPVQQPHDQKIPTGTDSLR